MDNLDIYNLMKDQVKKAAKRISSRYNLDSDEVEQESWAAMLSGLKRKDVADMDNPQAYLSFYIKRGRARSARFQKASESNDEMTESDEPSFSPDINFFISKGLLDGLTRDRLEVLTRHYAKDQTISEIAAEMGRSKQSVDQAHRLALAKIRKNMGVEL